jgi:CubicO group peptidase (beta-lactamase class C family)
VAVLVALGATAAGPVVGLGAAPVPRPSDAAAVAVSADRLARVEAFTHELVDDGRLPNSVTLVARHGKIVELEAAGWADAARQVPVRRDSLFRMYSMTKPITSVAVLILLEEGRLRLDDPVATYLPAFADQKVQQDGQLVAPDRPVTIRDLLTHTSGMVGLGEVLTTPGLVDLDVVTPMATLVDRLAALPLRSQPGTRFEYGLGQDIAGVVVERVSGQTLDAFMRERIFQPLGMDDTGFYVAPGKEKRLVSEFAAVPGPGGTWIPLVPGLFSSDKAGAARVHFGGGGWGGGVVSTVEDYARFALMLANDGELDGVRILSRKTVELMTTSQTGDLPTLAGPGYGFGLGVGVRTEASGLRTMGSEGRFGWSGAGFTTFFVDPGEDLVAIRLTNVLGADAVPALRGVNTTFSNLVYQSLD